MVKSPEERLEELVAEAVKNLTAEGLVEDCDDELLATEYGDMLCHFSIRFNTFIMLKNMPPKATMRNLVSSSSLEAHVWPT